MDPKSARKWSEECTNDLERYVEGFKHQGFSGQELWNRVSEQLEEKTPEQCMSKWYRDKNKKDESSKWSEEAAAQLSGYVDLYKSQEYRGPQLWGMVSEAMGEKWNAEQCMSKWYRDRSKQRRITCIGDEYLLSNGDVVHVHLDPDAMSEAFVAVGSSPKERCAKWSEETSMQLDKLVELYQEQDYNGTALWNMVSLQLNEKWTPSQCMSKWYRDKNRNKRGHLLMSTDMVDCDDEL